MPRKPLSGAVFGVLAGITVFSVVLGILFAAYRVLQYDAEQTKRRRKAVATCVEKLQSVAECRARLDIGMFP